MERRSMGEKWQEFGAHLESAPGQLPVEVRKQIRQRADGSGSDIPEDLAKFVDQVVEQSCRIIEQDAPAGRSDDEILETTIIAAFGAADRRYRAACRSWEGR
jgi:hypothetical protein